jgi:hypothetical protein
MLTSKQSLSKIKKYYRNSKFYEYDDIIDWYVDKDTKTSYSWEFELHGEKHEIKCNKENGKIEVL